MAADTIAFKNKLNRFGKTLLCLGCFQSGCRQKKMLLVRFYSLLSRVCALLNGAARQHVQKIDEDFEARSASSLYPVFSNQLFRSVPQSVRRYPRP